ncbi:MFS transporter [Isoptericola halotolerans]|uniref:MFS transporter n=1 Tax=Isoptericola halotolerans TaxID=300560 RepID=UPI00388E2477
MNSSSTSTSDEASPGMAGMALSAPSVLTLPVVLVGVALVAMSISGTAIALPNIGADLEATGSALNWVVAGYNLAFAAMTLVAGAAADRAGRRRIFIVASGVFSVGFLATAWAQSILMLDIARVVAGIGGAGVMAAGGALLASSYSGAARNRAFAFMGTMAGVGIAVGPTIVGGLISVAGWRGSFVAFAVLGALVACGAGRLQESRVDGSPTDWIGSVLSVAALGAFMLALLEGPELGWSHPLTWGAFAAGAAAAIAFAVSQRRSSAPILAPELVGQRDFMGWCLATLTTSIGFLGVLVFMPTYLQAAAGSTPATAGLIMLLLTAPVLITPVLAVALVNRGVSARVLILAALALVVVGNFGLLLLTPENTIVLIATPLLLIGIGMGTSFGITDGQAMALVPPRLVGTAAGFLNTLRGAAEALVIAVFSALLVGLLTTQLAEAGRASRVAAGDLVSSGGPEPQREIEALTSAWHFTQIVVGAACLLLSITVAMLLMSRSHRPVTIEGSEGVREFR